MARRRRWTKAASAGGIGGRGSITKRAAALPQPVTRPDLVAIQECLDRQAGPALALQLEDLDGALAAGDDETLAVGLEDLAGLAHAAAEARPVDLQRRAGVLGPGGWIGRETADVVVDLLGGLRPVDLGVLLEDLRRVAGAALVLDPRFRCAGLD